MGNTPPSLNTVLSCYRGGLVGQTLTDYLLLLPFAVWTSVGAVGYKLHLTYVQYIFWSSYISALLHLIIREIAQQPAPFPFCNTGFALPAVSVVLVYHYITMVLIHRIIWREPLLTIATVIRSILLGIGVPGALWWTGNHTFLQVFISAWIGITVGAICSTLLYCIALERMWVFSLSPFFGHYLGYRTHDLELEKLHCDWHSQNDDDRVDYPLELPPEGDDSFKTVHFGERLPDGAFLQILL